MEVHHHSYTSRKKWTHYFWEFFMLFLAVTAGFLVENQREHYVEHQREKQYMKSMIEDLKSDTSQISTVIQLKVLRNNMIDSLVFWLSSPGYRAHLNDIYFFARSVSPPLNFFPNDRTIQQLTNAGGFRLLRKQDADSIMKYESLYRVYKDNESTQLQNSIDNLRISYNLLVNFSANYAMIDTDSIEVKDSISASIPLFMTHDRGLINKYFNDLLRFFRNLQIQRLILKNLIVRADRHINYFKDKYRLK